MTEVTSSKVTFEQYSEQFGFVSSVEDWARKHRLNVYVAVYEHKEIKEPIVKEVETKGACSVLDVGCGYGFLMSRLNAVCPNTAITGVDVSRYQVLNAKLRRINGHLVVCCAEYMPFRSDFFDFVLCSEVIEHVANPAASLLEMARMLRRDGYVCVSTDNPFSIFRRISKVLFETINLKKTVKEEYISSNKLIEMIPDSIKVYKVKDICPYPLLPMFGPLGSNAVGKVWISLGRFAEKMPYVGRYFCNKYIVFGAKIGKSPS